MELVAYARTWYVLFGESDVILSVHGPPDAKPSVVLPILVAVVGFDVVPHTIPLTLITAPPSVTIVPPPEAVVGVILVTGVVVVTVGVVRATVVKDKLEPYDVPTLLVA